MKMTNEDFKIILDNIVNVANDKNKLKQFYNYKKQVIKENNFNNLQVRLAWDLFHALGIRKQIALYNYDDNAYLMPYKDEHYTTAILKACSIAKINLNK